MLAKYQSPACAKAYSDLTKSISNPLHRVKDEDSLSILNGHQLLNPENHTVKEDIRALVKKHENEKSLNKKKRKNKNC